MTVDPYVIDQVAEKEGFQRLMVEKVLRLLQVLDTILSESSLRKYLVLKGGSALNFFVLDFPRVSIDIDFNFIGAIEKDSMLIERENLSKNLVIVLERSGYIIEREMKSHAAERYALRYTNLQGSRDRIVIDINYMYRICLTEPESIQPKTTFIDFDSEVLILGRDELIASKLSALLERRAPRDLYDLHRVVQGKLNYNESLLRKLAILFTSGKKLDFRRLNADCLQDITQRSVAEELNPLLRVRDRASLRDMMESVEPLVLKTLNLSSKEAEFIDSLLERGNYNPTILFDNHEIIQKAKLHPLLHWKAMNVKKHKGIP